MILPKDLYYSLQAKVCDFSLYASAYANIELAIKMRDDLEVYVLLTIPPEDYLDTSQCEFTLFFPPYFEECEQDFITSGYLLHSLFAAQFDPLNRIIKWGALPG